MHQNKPITRSVSTSSVIDGNASKRPRDDTVTPAGAEENSDLLQKIKEMFEASNSKIEAKIDASVSMLEQRITSVEKQFSIFRSDCAANLNKLSTAITEVRNGVTAVSHRMDRLEKANDLLISGIPYAVNENLQNMFRNLASCLGYTDPDLPLVDLKRLMRLPITPGSSPPIACQFVFKNVRDEVYKRYLKSRNLTLRIVGFESDQRIYFNESLTPHARSIRTEAIKLKKNGTLLKVFTRNGIVYVQHKDRSEAEPINSVDQLRSQSSLNPSI